MIKKPSGYILTVTLNPAIDKNIFVQDLRVGCDHKVLGTQLSAGGKGLNVSRSLKTMGLPTLATGIVGGAAGDFILGELKREGIDADFLVIGPETRTNITIIDRSKKSVTRTIEPGPVLPATLLNSFKNKLKKLLRGASFAIFSGSNANGFPDSSYAEMIGIARRAGVDSALDTRSRPLSLGIKAGPSIVKPNIEEAEFVAGKILDSLTKIRRAAAAIQGMGAGAAIITMGSKGALFFDGVETIQALPSRVKVLNDVGCGDTFLGAYVASIMRGADGGDAMRSASAIAAASSLTAEPGKFRRKDAIAAGRKVLIKRFI